MNAAAAAPFDRADASRLPPALWWLLALAVSIAWQWLPRGLVPAIIRKYHRTGRNRACSPARRGSEEGSSVHHRFLII